MLGVFFQQTINDAGLQVMGMFLAMFGLTLFLDGLRVAIMPLAEVVGTQLPKRLHIFFVLLIAGMLGILVTYAEPAISSLRPLAKLVDPNAAPYLYFIMNDQQELLVFAIGAGVGVAAIIGTLRFMKNLPLVPLIFGSLAPTIGLACYMQWGNPDLGPVIGMAWDCGAVTTGPVTVPVLLALGIGVMQSSRKRRLATAAMQGSVAQGAGGGLEGFGIVTLASLWPILAVELMAVIDGAIYDNEYVLNKAREGAANADEPEPVYETSPWKEVIYGLRAILPLTVFLFIIILLILRVPLPECSFWVDPPADDDLSTRSIGDASVTSRDDEDDASIRKPSALARKSVTPVEIAMDISKAIERVPSEQSIADSDPGTPKKEVSVPELGEDEDAEEKVGCWTRFGRVFRHHLPLIGGITITQIGMICFNEGLTYSFTKLGDQTGATLPAAFLTVARFSKSPYYSYAGGLILVIVTVFLLGVLATRAEPALNVLGRTVERLSGGTFTSRMLITSVCIGVGIGLSVGVCKILFSWQIIYFILGKYAIACMLTLFSKESILAVGWDSAGVTTGPVTVPFVLSIGIGASIAVNSPEGFGMLTIASVSPIISVLTMALIRKPAQAVKKQLSMKARALGRQVTNMRAMRSMKRSPSTAMAAFFAAGDSTTVTPDSSLRGGDGFSPSMRQ